MQLLQYPNSHFNMPNSPSAEKVLAVEVQDVLESIYICKHQVIIHMNMEKISFLIPQCAHGGVSIVALNKYFRIAFVLKLLKPLRNSFAAESQVEGRERFLFTYCNLLYFF